MIPNPSAPATADRLITLAVWADPLVEQLGHGPLSRYCEMCWTPVLGPTSLGAARIRFLTVSTG